MSIPRYFVSHTSATWDSTANWSATSAGPGGASVPDPTNTVYFDGSGTGRCILNTPVSIYGLRIDLSYNGTIEQDASNLPIVIGEDGAVFDGGIFEGGTADITIDGTTIFSNTRFVSTKAELKINGYFQFQQPSTDSSKEELLFEEITVTPSDLSRKYVILSQTPDPGDTSNVVLNIEHGSSQYYGSDYYVNNDRLIWDGKGLDGELLSGNILRVIYPVLQNPGFFHNRGTVVLNTASSSLNGGGATFFNLNFRKDGTDNLYCQNDSSCYVDGILTLEDGNIKQGTDATIHVIGDIDVWSTFGSKTTKNTANILIDGDSSQTINTDGGILPSLTINKNTSAQVTATGSGPLSIYGDLLLLDGTFNTNGIDLQVGPI